MKDTHYVRINHNVYAHLKQCAIKEGFGSVANFLNVTLIKLFKINTPVNEVPAEDPNGF